VPTSARIGALVGASDRRLGAYEEANLSSAVPRGYLSTITGFGNIEVSCHQTDNGGNIEWFSLWVHFEQVKF
jgi:hypothetical protein